MRATVRVDRAGRIVIPREIRKLMRLEEGRAVDMELTDDGLRIWTPEIAIKRIVKIMEPHRWKPGDPLWSEQIIEERREEARREYGEPTQK